MAARLLCTLLYACVLLGAKTALSDPQKCQRISPCYFLCNDKIMDLRELEIDDPIPLWKDQFDIQGKNRFSFDPCTGFDEGVGCKNTSVCQLPGYADCGTKGCHHDNIDVGSPDSAVLTLDTTASGDQNTLTFTHTVNKVKKTTMVDLKCQKANTKCKEGKIGCHRKANADLFIQGESPEGSNTYKMTLTSQHACLKAAPAPTAQTTEATTPETTVTTTPEPTKPTTEVTNTTTPKPTTEPTNTTTPKPTTEPTNTTTPKPTTEQTTEPTNTTTPKPTTEPTTVPTSEPRNTTSSNVTSPSPTIVTSETTVTSASNTSASVTTQPSSTNSTSETSPASNSTEPVTSPTTKKTTPAPTGIASPLRSSFVAAIPIVMIIFARIF